MVFSLAGIEPASKLGEFKNLESDTLFRQAHFQNDFSEKASLVKKHFIDARSHCIDSAFRALAELMKLERAIKGAYSVLDGQEPSDKTDLKLVRDLLLEQHANEAVGSVLQLQRTLKLTNPDGLNIPERIETELKPIVAWMRAKARKL